MALLQTVAARLRRVPLVLDAALALGAFALAMGLIASERFNHGGDMQGLDALGGVLAALACLPLAWRRRAPLVVYSVTTAATAALYGLDYSLGPPVGSAVALFTIAVAPSSLLPRTRRVIGVVLALMAGVAVVHLAVRSGSPGPELALGALVWGGAWILGDQARQRRERMAALEERALRAEREADRERRLAAAQERMRIARDLHDSAGHAINVILVQAGAARLLRERDPERSRVALETIEDVARETIGEIDRLVRALREDGGGDGVEPPGLAALDALVDRHRAAGLGVSVAATGRRRPLVAGVDRAAYRILQEALTNAALHGDGSARVDLGFGEDGLELTVTNRVRADGAPRPGGGHGLVGMRERALLLGGTLDAGADDGVFRVHARLPVNGAA